MTTLLIFTKESTHDQNELDIYQSQVSETFEGHPLKLIAAGTPQILEGPASERVVVLEFPTTEAAREWYGSAPYQAIIQHRFNGTKHRVVLVEGT